MLKKLILVGIVLVALGLVLIPKEGITTVAEVRESAPDHPAVSACAMGFAPLVGSFTWAVKTTKNGRKR